MEFAVRAIDSYVLLFPDDPDVIRFTEAMQAYEDAADELGRWPDAD